MARFVKVSALCPRPLPLPEETNDEALVRRMGDHLRACISPVLPDRPDLILLPEMCDRYDGMNPARRRSYFTARGDSIQRMLADVAREHRCHIAYSSALPSADGTWRNATLLLGRDGRPKGEYHKNHLVVNEGPLNGPFPMRCGSQAPVIPLDFGTVGCAICFDLNFDELRRRYMESRPEMLLFSSMYHGGFMQQAWAYDCRSWFVSAVAGQQAQVISPVGQVVATSTNYFPHVTARINLDCAVIHLDFNWDRIRAAKEKYGEKVGFFDPGRLGAALLTSECEEFTVEDLIREFGFERLDDYFARSRADRSRRNEP